MSKQRSGGDGLTSAHDLAQSEAAPMLKAPFAPGVGGVRTLSPLMFFAMTNEPRADVDGLGDDIGLYEEPCATIDKRGVRLFNRWYTHPEIQPYATGDKRLSQRKLVIRYDRALAARGVLEEVQLLEQDDQGRYLPLLMLLPHEVVKQRWSKDDLLRRRNLHVKALVAKRTDRQQSYAMLERGLGLVNRMVDESLARERLQRRRTEEPRPATPIEDSVADPRSDALSHALGAASALRSDPGPGTMPREDGDVSSSAGDRDMQAPTKRTRGRAAESTARAEPETEALELGAALGGTIGMRRRR